jgi:microcystin-dependent protein
MAINKIAYFFDSLNPNRFKNYDIPTEAIFRDLMDSIAFFKEVSSTSQRTKGGLAKTTSDDKVNNRDNTDQAGVSPIGFTTFVRPAQIPIVVGGTDITVTPTIRVPASDPDGETGAAILDYVIDYTGVVPTDTDDIVLASNITFDTLDNPYPYTVASSTIIAGNTTTFTLQALANALGTLANQLDTVADKLAIAEAALAANTIPIGDVFLSYTSPAGWDTNYLEPRGQNLTVAQYPALYALIGVQFGGIVGTNFNLPDLSEDTAYVGLLRSGTAGVGTITGVLDYTLTVANIPEHTHDFSGTTDIDGAHTHPITVKDTDPGFIVVDGNGGGAPGSNTDNTSIQSTGSDHAHNIPSQPTDPWGTLAPTAIPLTPRRMNHYLKMRVK